RRVPPICPCHLPADGKPLPRLYAALDPLDTRRLHHSLSGLGRGPSGFHRSASHARLPVRLRSGQARAWRRGGYVRAPIAYPDRDFIDAQAADKRDAAMSIVVASSRRAHWNYRLRRRLTEAGSIMLGLVLLVWSLLPIYNMLLIALDPEEGEIE